MAFYDPFKYGTPPPLPGIGGTHVLQRGLQFPPPFPKKTGNLLQNERKGGRQTRCLSLNCI